MHNFFDSIFVKIIARIAKNVNICETEVTLTKECAHSRLPGFAVRCLILRSLKRSRTVLRMSTAVVVYLKEQQCPEEKHCILTVRHLNFIKLC